MELERLTLAQDPRVRVEEAEYADAMGEAAVATSTGIRATGRESGCYVVVSTLADRGRRDPDRLRLLGRPRRPASSTSTKAARRGRRAGHPPARAPPSRPRSAHRGVRPVRHRAVPVGAVGRAQRGVGAEGTVAVRQPRRRGGGLAALHPGRRPDQPAGLLGHARRRRGSRHPAHVAHRGRRPPGLPAELLQRPAQRDGLDRQRGRGASSRRRRAAPSPSSWRPAPARRPSWSPASTTACSSSRSPASTPA